MIVAHALTEPTVDAATIGIDLIETVDDEIARSITDVRTLGRRRWKKEAGYHLQARVENAFFRYKSIIGDRLRARSRGGRVAEVRGRV